MAFQMGKVMEDLLKCEEHLDVTIVCDDGEVKASKFILTARSEYFATMFKSDNFKESSGKVLMPCKKIVMDKVIEFLYGGIFYHSQMPAIEVLLLLDMFRLMMLEDAFTILEEYFIATIVDRISRLKFLPSLLLYYFDLLDLALNLKLENISTKFLHALAPYLPEIVETTINRNVIPTNSVILALTSCDKADVFATFRLINHFKNTTFVGGDIPNINLEALTVDQLEKDVVPSGLYKESDVYKIVIAKQKAVIASQIDEIADQKTYISVAEEVIGNQLILISSHEEQMKDSKCKLNRDGRKK